PLFQARLGGTSGAAPASAPSRATLPPRAPASTTVRAPSAPGASAPPLAADAATATTAAGITAPAVDAAEPAVEATPSRPTFAELRVVGQAFGGFIVCESRTSLVLIDQHAAHERVRFERLRAAPPAA